MTRSARDVAAGASRSEADDAAEEELADGLEELVRRIDDFARERATSRRLAESLDHAATLADAALAGLGRETRPPTAMEEDDGSGSGQGVRQDPGVSAGPGSGASDIPGAGVANDGSAGTMSAPPSEGGASRPAAAGEADGTPTAAPRTEGLSGGLTLDRWWPRRHADLAARWVEARRADPTTGDDPLNNPRD